MSDLALPPLTLVAPEPRSPDASAKGEGRMLVWPQPPAGRYPSTAPQAGGLPCELEGLNGRMMRVTLTKLDLLQGGVEVVSPGLRAPMQLRFAQFRRLSLPGLIEPETNVAADLIQSYRLRSRTGTDRNGLTVGHVETPSGVFLFEPQDSRGAVRRVFVPATAYESLSVGGRLLPGAGAAAARSDSAAPARPASAGPAAGPVAPRAGQPPGPASAPVGPVPPSTPSPSRPAAVPVSPVLAPRTPPVQPRPAAPASPVTPVTPVVPAASAAPVAPRAASGPAPMIVAPIGAAARSGTSDAPQAGRATPGQPPVARPMPAHVAHPAPGTPVAPAPTRRPESPPATPAFPTLADAAIDLTPPWRTAKPAAPGPRPHSPAPKIAAVPTPKSSDDAITLNLDLSLEPLAETPVAPAREPEPTVANEVLRSKPIVTADELLLAVERQARMPVLRMGEALIALGYINAEQLEQALAKQQGDRGVPLGEILVRSGFMKRGDLQQAMVRKMGYPVIDLEQFTPDTEALAKVSYAQASRLGVLPLLLRSGRLYVAMEDPTRGKTLDELEFASGCKPVPALAPQGRIAAAIDTCYQKMGAETGSARTGLAEADGESLDAAELLASLESEGVDRSVGEDDRGIEQSDNSLVRLINQMILEAQSMGVSDIHIESQPGREKVRIRFRRDGVLRPYMELPHTYRNALIARIKIMCDLDISEKRKPQDGKIAFGKFHAGSRLELRVATIPTANGLEDAVMRLLASARPLPLDDIGLSARNLALVKSIVDRPYGMFLCVGPTGSGKTTTLHSALGYINKPDRKIWTAEDPIEITQSGLRQVQVNPKIELTFARALRAFLRADPDVIMVGEIRDKETAAVSVESSLTGHLVLSTLHTNSAPETVTRLLDMGMDPFNFADALLGVLAQRLVRRICSGCRASREAAPAEIEEMLGDYLNAFGSAEVKPSEDEVLASWRERFGLDGRLHHYHGAGCDKCGGSGLRGRAGIHELMTISRDVRRLIQTGARVEQLQKAAMAEGMLTLRQDGIEKVLQGVTTLAEVRSSSN
jgi:type II secretory ATPase GspE/PulE/Tfp pilus assembly ATPase PilB-like protein